MTSSGLLWLALMPTASFPITFLRQPSIPHTWIHVPKGISLGNALAFTSVYPHLQASSVPSTL